MKKRYAAIAGLLALVGLTVVVFFGRHGEYAVPFTVGAPPEQGVFEGGSVRVEGAVLRRSEAEHGLPLIWATRPEFTVAVTGISAARPLRVHNALALDAYRPLGPGVEAGRPGELLLVAPGTFSFRTHLRNDYSFLVMGDPRGHVENLEAALHLDEGSLFALCLGDLVRGGNAAQYARVASVASRSSLPVYFTVGNHDLEKGGRRRYRALFGEENYSFTIGNDLFSVLDTAADYPYLGDHRVSRLRSLLDEPGHRHHFVFFHTPPVDPRPGHNHRLRYVLLRRGLERVLADHGVPVAFAGHIHDYQEALQDGVRYVITGGLNTVPENSVGPHVVRVRVRGETFDWQVLPLKPDQPGLNAVSAVSH